MGSGKTQLLRRLALEAIVAHDGEAAAEKLCFHGDLMVFSGP